MTTGLGPYVAEEVTDTDPAANVVETTIVVDETNVAIGNGVTAHALTFSP